MALLPRQRAFWLLACGAATALVIRSGRAEEATPAKPAASTAAAAPAKAGASDQLAKAIDAYVAKRVQKEGIEPAPLADDAEFLRRVWLDIAGGTPDPVESIAVLADKDPEKRRKKIDELLAKQDTARNWAEFWTDVMEGEATTKKREDQIKIQFRTWFENQLHEGVAFDELTRRIISAEGYVQENGAVGYVLSYTGDSKNPDPKTLAATTARVFMGLQIECAQCHDHPFADWKRDQFMGLAAYFSRAKYYQQRIEPPLSRKELEKLPQAEREKLTAEFKMKQQRAPFGIRESEKGEFYAEVQTVRNPGEKAPPPAPTAPAANDKNKKKNGKEKEVEKKIIPGKGDEPAKYLVMPAFVAEVPATTGKDSKKDDDANLRALLGKLITDPKNPFFARNCANRIWGRVTGRPLLAPSEDLSDQTAANDNELLALLGKGFKDVKYDHKQFLRAVCLTDAYQRSSRTTVDHSNKEEYAKLVRAEQLYAVGVVRPIDARPLARAIVGAVTVGAKSLDDVVEGRLQQALLVRFERLFGESNMDPKKYEETIPQALFLMNGQGTNRGGMRGGGKNAKGGPAMVATPSQGIAGLMTRYEDPRERVTRIYLASLCRPPKKVEIDDALAFLKDAGGQGDAYEDLLWALLNSAEFRFNR
jgi:hypothetical protein